jgi:hypothetical protein
MPWHNPQQKSPFLLFNKKNCVAVWNFSIFRPVPILSSPSIMDHREEQENELMALESIYYDEYTCCVAPFFYFFAPVEHDGRIVFGSSHGV